MAPQPATVFTLSAPLDPAQLAQFASDKAGVPIRVRTSERFPSWWFEVGSDVKPDVELHFRGDEVLITAWPEYPHEYFAAIAEAFLVSQGARPRHPSRPTEARGRLLMRYTWQQYRAGVIFKRRLASVAAALLIVILLVAFAGLRR
jgi:hypothetical protein